MKERCPARADRQQRNPSPLFGDVDGYDNSCICNVVMMRADQPSEAGKPFPVLLRKLAEESATLVRAEFALAKSELAERGRNIAPLAAMAGAAALLALGAFGALTICIIAALSLVTRLWAAALIVTAIYAIVAFALVQLAKKRLQTVGPIVPQQTAQSVKEDVEWAKTRAKSGVR